MCQAVSLPSDSRFVPWPPSCIVFWGFSRSSALPLPICSAAARLSNFHAISCAAWPPLWAKKWRNSSKRLLTRCHLHRSTEPPAVLGAAGGTLRRLTATALLATVTKDMTPKELHKHVFLSLSKPCTPELRALPEARTSRHKTKHNETTREARHSQGTWRKTCERMWRRTTQRT